MNLLLLAPVMPSTCLCHASKVPSLHLSPWSTTIHFTKDSYIVPEALRTLPALQLDEESFA